MKLLTTPISLILIFSLFILFPIIFPLRAAHRSTSLSSLNSRVLNSKDSFEQDLQISRFLETTTKSHLSKRRYTKDGRLCATAFVQDGKTYTDCTSAKSPDGQLTEKEWCYVDPNAGGSPNWAFCKPVLDYDKVRMKARDLMLELIVEVRKVTDLIAGQINPCVQTISLLESIRTKQNNIDARCVQEQAKIGTLETNYQSLLVTKTVWEAIDLEIEKLEQEVKVLKEAAENSNARNPYDCNGMLGYEAEGTGDGTLAKYYDNEDFLGKTLDRVDPEMNFVWERESPAPGINEENFSIKWSTWLRIPTNGKYRFYTESDDGNSLYVNGQFLISHFMGSSSVSGTNKKSSWLSSNFGNKREDLKDFSKDKTVNAHSITTKSQAVDLNGGMKYKLDFLMYHSVHNENEEDGKSFARLFWSSDEIEKQVISKNFLYTANKMPPVKISSFNPSLIQLAVLKENESAFKDSEEYKLQDIPFQYQNKPALLFITEYSEETISFSSTAPITVFLAIDSNKPNPLPTEFENQNEVLSVLRILKTSKPIDNKVHASESLQYKIYKQKFPAGKIQIKLVKSKRNPTNRIVLFYSLDAAASNPISCGGESQIISNPNNEAYQTCETSSKYQDEGWNCAAALSGSFLDNRSAMWASDGQGIGAWLLVKFKGIYQINKLQIKNRGNPSERNAKIELTFGSEGQPQQYSLQNIDEIQDIALHPPVSSSQLKITIKEVYGTINNGFAMNVWGTPCFDSTKAETGKSSNSAQPSSSKKKSLKLTCEDTFKNRDDFERLNIKEGDKITVICTETCALSKTPIFGDNIYSDDSSICKAAYHSGSLLSTGGKVILTVVRGESYYKSTVKSGVKSETKQATRVAVQFQAGNNQEASDLVHNGMKVDVFDTKLNQWLPGTIQSSEKVSKTKTKITVSKDGYGPEYNEVLKWPLPEKVTFCGEMLKERVCDQSSTSPESPSKENLKFVFGPGPLKVAGYLLDEGKEFGKKGNVEYGWSRDVSNLARSRHLSADPLNDNLILFPPDSKSKWCQETTPPVTCESIDWMVKVNPGRYTIKVTVGDAANKAQYDLSINDKKVLNNKVLKKNQFFTTNDEFSVLEGQIRLTSTCESDCQFSWTRISALEIIKLPDSTEPSSVPPASSSSETIKLDCGIAYQDGKCHEGTDIENCIYNGANDVGISGCGGLLEIVKIPKSYECKGQAGKYKCIKAKFDTNEDCKSNCPGKCLDNVCNTGEQGKF